MELEPVTCFHMVDGSIVLGVADRTDGSAISFTLKDPLILTKAKPFGTDTVKAVLMYYATFSDDVRTEIKVYYSGLLSEYRVGESVEKFYHDFLKTSTLGPDTSNQESISSTVQDLIDKMRESMGTSSNSSPLLDVEEMRKILGGDDLDHDNDPDESLDEGDDD